MRRIILGLWPLAGITSGHVTREQGLATIQAGIDAGIQTFDTAFSYGYEGESDRMLGEILRRKQNQHQPLSIIGKVGQRWTSDHKRIVDGFPAQLTADAEASLRRIGVARFDLLMLHGVDPRIEIERSAEALGELRRRGLAEHIGVCNVSAAELTRFADVCDCQAIQCPLNLFQRASLDPLIRTATSRGTQSHVYWTLMKGLLAGHIGRDHVFEAGDSRPGYDIFQGAARQHAHDVVDRLAVMADRLGTSVAKLAIGWALSQPGVTAALVGAKRPAQIHETADATPLTREVLEQIEHAASTE
ncbi:MAG: aldo/keto reductase [Planctomycetaceae bacterium]